MATDLNNGEKLPEEHRLGKALVASLAAGAAPDACPSLEEIGALAEGALGPEQAERIFGHLALCDDCDATFRAAREFVEEQQSPARRRLPYPRRRYLLSGLAAAALFALAIAGVLKTQAPPQVAQQLPGADRSVTTPSAPQPLPAPQAEPAPQTQPAPAARRAEPAAPAGFLAEAATDLAGSKAELAPAESDSFGFAAPRSTGHAAQGFAVGRELVRLAAAVRLGDADLARDCVARLRELPLSAPLSAELRDLDQALTAGPAEKAVALTRFASLPRLFGADYRYLRAGIWAEAARIAAATEGSGLLQSPGFAAEAAALRDAGLPAPAVTLVGEIAALARHKPLSHGTRLKIVRLVESLAGSLSGP